MNFERTDTEQYDYETWECEENGIQLSLQLTVMGSTRVVVHPNDDMSLWCNICCGDSVPSIVEVMAILITWLKDQDDVEHVSKTLQAVQKQEKIRPWGKDPDFQKALYSLPFGQIGTVNR